MTELEKIEYARTYIERLANGINPLTNREVPETDTLNNVRIARCLFYVSDLLRQVVAAGGIPEKAKREKKAPFELPAEARLRYRFSDTPIPVSEIVRRVNELIDPQKMLKLNYRAVTEWLTESGFLTVQMGPDGKAYRLPTQQGSEAGISFERRQGTSGVYFVTVYDRAAQQLILDNLDAAIERSRRIKDEAYDTSRQGEPWTAAQEEVLADLYKKRVPVTEIAVTLKRTKSAVREHLLDMGLAEGRGGPR